MRQTVWVGLVATLLLQGCLQLHAGESDLAAMLQRNTSLETLDGLSDREFAIRYQSAKADGRFAGSSGEAAAGRLQGYLAERFRRRYPNIPKQLWLHLAGGDLTALLEEPAVLTDDIEDRSLRHKLFGRSRVNPGRLGHPPAVSADEPETYIPSVSYASEGETVMIPGGKAAVGGCRIVIPKVVYRPPGDSEDLAAMVEAVLAELRGKAVKLGEPFAQGGMRVVYEDPDDPSALLKVYDPVRIDRIRVEGRIEVPTPVLVAYFLQRDLAVMRILQALQDKYRRLDLEPPFELILLEDEAALLQRGIVVQRKVSGLSAWKRLPEQLTPSSLALLDRFFSFHKRYDRQVSEFVTSRYALYLRVQPTANDSSVKVGIDYGRNYSNFFLTPSGTLALYDW